MSKHLIKFWLLVVAVCSSFASSAMAITTVWLIGPDLQQQQVQLQSMRDDVISYFDAGRALQTQPLDNLLQMRIIGGGDGDIDKDVSEGMIYLTDGQQITGRLIGAGDDGESLYWRHAKLGDMVISLEQVRRMDLIDVDNSQLQQPTTDRVVMTNGDVINGFVLAVSSSHIELHQPGDGLTLKLAIDRVARMLLADGGDKQAVNVNMLWFSDGSCVAGRSMSISRDLLTFKPLLKSLDDRKPSTIELSQLRSIDFVSRSGRLLDLVDLPMNVTSGGKPFAVDMPPRQAGSSLWMHGPVTVVFDLPQGTQRFTATVMLDRQSIQNSSLMRWADVQVVITVDDQVLKKCVINDVNQAENINIMIHGDQLTIELKEGKNGPIMDRVAWRDAMVYVVGR